MFLPIPSLNNKYEIDERGNARNAKTLQRLKPLRRTKGGLRYRFCFAGAKVERTIAQLLFEVHGITPPRCNFNSPIPVTVAKDGVRKTFPSIDRAAKFIADKTFYAWYGVRNFLSARRNLVYGWQCFYHEPKQRIFRTVERLVGEKYLRREDEYWSRKQ